MRSMHTAGEKDVVRTRALLLTANGMAFLALNAQPRRTIVNMPGRKLNNTAACQTMLGWANKPSLSPLAVRHDVTVHTLGSSEGAD